MSRTLELIELGKVAALLSLEVDMLRGLLEEEDLTLKRLRDYCQRIVTKRDTIITDDDARDRQYNAAALLIDAADRGLIQTVPLKHG